MSNHSQTFSYPAGGYGYSSPNNKNEAAKKHSTKLTSVAFVGLPTGAFPAGAKIYLTPVKSNLSPIAYRNYHNASHLANGTIKHDGYFSDYEGTVNNVKLRAYSSNETLGNTIGATWNFGYVVTM